MGEEGGDAPVTLAIGEGGDQPVVTLAIGEEGIGHLPTASMGSGSNSLANEHQHIFGGEGLDLGDRLERLFELADSIVAGDIHVRGL